MAPPCPGSALATLLSAGVSAGAGVGAVHAYDLAGSGMGCAQARAFVQKLSDTRPSAGVVELMGHGACELPYPGLSGRCIVEDTGDTYRYELKQ
ncbi:hypothetical protein GCM10009715_26090 [Paeniglutamicibacter psychrophenolicus]|uniref:Uncharacterized protein n=1 Tax=Paeniglutamicibacter psychrophenolicus TaxID=257454 RepID=A0ABS4WEC1_9MICC|nr:hypothetical protein [Paeniglutamicibacter psychrophenolicus]MBP2374564.1 hypothetical protein [Paeniglutamicibacter psychrophenolicus]